MPPADKAAMAASGTFGVVCILGAVLGIVLNVTSWWLAVIVFPVGFVAGGIIGKAVYAANTEYWR